LEVICQHHAYQIITFKALLNSSFQIYNINYQLHRGDMIKVHKIFMTFKLNIHNE